MTNENRPIRAYIVDDSVEAIEVLQRILEANHPVEVAGTANDGPTAIDQVAALQPDIIFTDVEMPSMTGIEFCRAIRNKVSPDTKVVFYTGHDKYMIDALRQQAFDFLLKPCSPEDVAMLMMRYYENKLSTVPALSATATPRHQSILVVNAMSEHIVLQAPDIAFFRFNADRKLWEVVCCNGDMYSLRTRTNSDVILDYSTDFVQIHKRYIVNVLHVKMIQNSLCILNEPLHDINELKVSKNFKRSLLDAFYAL